MKYIKLFEEFSNSDFKADFEYEFTENEGVFNIKITLKDRLAFVKIPQGDSFDTSSGKGGTWYIPKNEIEALVQGKNDPLIEHINEHLRNAYEQHNIPEHVLIDDNEEIEKIDDNTFLAKIKVKKETYNSWIIRTKGSGWVHRTSKNYGL